jgi:hypothetical protein
MTPPVPDWKAAPRVKDPELMRRLHQQLRECEVTGTTGRLSLHHINRHPRDDVRGNLVMVDGSGTTGFHGHLEARDPDALKQLGRHIIEDRPDTLDYLRWRFPKPGQAEAWLERHYLVRWSA